MKQSVALAAALLLSVSCTAATQPADTLIPAASRGAAPAFSLVDAQGKQINLADLKGKVVLLDFWATWCGGCKLEIPWFIQFDEKYRQQGLSAVGVSMDDDGWKSVRPFLAKGIDAETHGNIAMKYPVVIGSQELANQYHLGNMPMTVLIDRNGRIALSHTGVVDKAKFEAAIVELLK
jgi:cytochrome c biogenesis protein CcmG/thiol:disulfide interchange protein DsbE